MRENSKEDEPIAVQQHTNVTPMPKHIPFPDPASSSELLNELIMFLFTTCASSMQFINIFRTNWWIPGIQSQITNTVVSIACGGGGLLFIYPYGFLVESPPH